MQTALLYQCGDENSEHIPLGVGYLLSNCSAPGWEVRRTTDRNELRDCDLIGLSTNAWGIREAIHISRGASAPVAVGGQGVLWEGLAEAGNFRWIVRGDGEGPFADILKNGVLGDYSPVDLDDLLPPTRNLSGDQIVAASSRGCPHHCGFCSSSEYWGSTRFRSAEGFVGEVLEAIGLQPNASTLYLVDDLFIAHKPRLLEIRDLWLSRGIKLTPQCFIRSDMFDADCAQALKDMGTRMVRFGAESGSNAALKRLGKHLTVEDHDRCIETALAHGLIPSYTLMFGTPGETKEDIALTQAFIDRWRGKAVVSGVYKYRSFPGTPLYDGSDPRGLDMRVRLSTGGIAPGNPWRG